MNELSCSDIIISNNYYDLIVYYENDIDAAMKKFNAACYQIIDKDMAILHIKEEPDVCKNVLEYYDINNTPRILSPNGKRNMKKSGITVFHKQAPLRLRGQGVIMGFVDSGIDYTHPVFTYNDNTTKIISIWDQTIQGNPPKDFGYGTEYNKVLINKALKLDDPYELVPSKDKTGHGTFLAGIAAGREIIDVDFVGAAPDSEIIMVKLKQAKNCLKEQYFVPPDVIVYQDTDVMMGINYLMTMAKKLNRPIIITIGLSNNMGVRNGTSNLELYLSKLTREYGTAIVVSAGNEADKGHHYKGLFLPEQRFQDIEFNVATEEAGLYIYLFTNIPDILSTSIISPSGQIISRIPPPAFGESGAIELLLEETKIIFKFILIPDVPTIVIVLVKPTEGIWTIRLYGDLIVNGRYDIYLPGQGRLKEETRFLFPNPYNTITLPGTTDSVITSGAYNHRNNTLWVSSSRGYTLTNTIKPDLVAPGVNVFGPLPDNTYGSMTGTSIAAAHVAGASALLLEWSLILGNNPNMNNEEVKILLRLGAKRNPIHTYPNRKWGYGMLDLLNTFENL